MPLRRTPGKKIRDSLAVSCRFLCLAAAGTGLAVYVNGAKAVEPPRKCPIKSKIPRARRGLLVSGQLPLAHFLLAVGKDHVIQVAPDPGCRHSGITLLSFVFRCYYMPVPLDLQGEI